MSFASLPSVLAAEINRAAAAAPAEAEQVTVELAISAGGRTAPSIRRAPPLRGHQDDPPTSRPTRDAQEATPRGVDVIYRQKQQRKDEPMPALKTYDLFISHAWTYNAEYERLVKMLNDAPNFKWRNYSVTKQDPLDVNNDTKLTEALKRQIGPVNCVLILAGMYVNHRKWIKKEITIAQNLNKPIVGIRPWGQQRTPIEVQQAANVMVGWNTSSIVQAIRDYSI